jgi:hypothetical protein
LIQTLTWQGAHVVAQLGIDSPGTKSDLGGLLTDEATIAEIERLAATLVATPSLDAHDRLELVHSVVETAHVDTGHIAPPDPSDQREAAERSARCP